jgi:hypothetical protein
MFKKLAVLAVAGILTCTGIYAASVPLLTQWDPTNGQGVLNGLINSINSNITPGSMGSFITGRNLLDNGDMWVDQRAATSAITCGTTTTSGMTAGKAYGADRWLCDVNITTGAGSMLVATATPTPPVGFINESQQYRTSGALLAPQCTFQELNTYKSTAIAGQVVNFSVYAEALAGLSADNGNLAFLEVITGTDTAGGFGLRGAKGMATSTKASSFTISTSTGLITNATSVVAGQPITITAATIPTGFTQGATYYVSTNLLNSGTAFTVAPTYAQAIAGTGTVIPSTGGTTDVLNYTPAYPAWTTVAVYGANNAGAGQTSVGQAFGQVQSQAVALSATNWTRISTGPISIPTGTTEVAVAICFPPAGTTSGGTTDGIAFTGGQLEVMGVNQTTPSTYEFKSPALEQAEAETFFYLIYDQAAHTVLPGFGQGQSSTVCLVTETFPVPMDAAPIYASYGTIASTTFKVLTGTTETTISAAAQPSTNLTANSPLAGAVALTTTGQTAGSACQLTGQTAQSVGVSWTADF